MLSLAAIQKINHLTAIINIRGVGRVVTSQLKCNGTWSPIQICSRTTTATSLCSCLQQSSGTDPTRVKGSTCNVSLANTGKRERKLNNKRHALHWSASPCESPSPTPFFFFLACLLAHPINYFSSSYLSLSLFFTTGRFAAVVIA